MATTTFPSRSEASNTATAGKDYLIYLNAGESDTNPTWLLLGSVTECSLSTPHDDVATLSGTISGDGPLSDLKSADGTSITGG